MSTITVKKGEPIESALRRFKAMNRKEGLLDYLASQPGYYKSPAERRREKDYRQKNKKT
jgi:ribosomal protein S21